MSWDNIPAELKAQRQWVCYTAVPDALRPGKYSKKPINPLTGEYADSTDPTTWTDFDTAASQAPYYDGVGFVMANGFFGIYIDGVESEIEKYNAGDTDNIISEVISTLGSYAEYSRSGHGIHVICKGKKPGSRCRKGNFEMYETGRFFVMTGNRCSKYTEVVDCTESVKILYNKYIGNTAPPSEASSDAEPVDIPDDELMRKISQSRQGTLFGDLWEGNYGKYYSSQSEADLALCNILAFWTGRDRKRMDDLFRQSGLMRSKWDRKQAGTTYGALTISKAVSECIKVYQPKAKYSRKFGTEEKVYSLDDTGNAEMFHDYFGDKIRYNYVDKTWHYWDGIKWNVDNTGEVKKLVDKLLNVMASPVRMSLYSDKDEVRDAYEKHLKRSRGSQRKNAILEETKHLCAVLPDEIDCDPMLLNTPAGIVDLHTGKISPHDPEKFMTRCTGVEPSSKCQIPQWENFLETVFDGNQEKIRAYQIFCGYSLTGLTNEQVAFFPYGDGLNGKSTAQDTLSDILGSYAMNIQPESLMVKHGSSGGPNSDIARLKGARMVVTSESNEGERLNEGLLKQLTGGDKITARRLYGNEFEYIPQFKLWFNTNHKPNIRGTDKGIWRRIVLIPFTVTIPANKVDKNLKYKLMSEAPGILSWMIDGCLKWQQDGIFIPLEMQQAVSEYRTEMDIVQQFLNECCEELPGAMVSASDLYKAYARWADDSGEYKMTKTMFGRKMAEKREKVRKSGDGRYFYSGLALKVNRKFAACE